MKTLPLIVAALCVCQGARAEDALVQPVIDGCIERLIDSGAVARGGGQVIDTMYSEAGSMVFLQDAEGQIWQCLGYRDGTVETLEPADAEAAEAALARAADKLAMVPQRIEFAPGSSGTEVTRTFEAGGALQFSFGARAGQTLDLSLVSGGRAYYHMRNPDGSPLLAGTDAASPFSGALPQSGDYLLEVVSQESAPQEITVTLSIN